MMQTLSSRWLVGIAVVVAILILVSVVIALTNPRGATVTFPESEPEGIVQRYILALQDEDYSLAHGYFSDELRKACSLEHMRDTSRWLKDREQDQRVVLLDKETLSSERVRVRVRVTEVNVSPPFRVDEYSHDERYVLVREDDAWRLDEPPWPLGWCPGLEIEGLQPRPVSPAEE